MLLRDVPDIGEAKNIRGVPDNANPARGGGCPRRATHRALRREPGAG